MHYLPRLSRYTETYRILDWEDSESQQARFNVLIDSVSLEGKSLLDVGCGCGDLLLYLKHRGIELKYTGVDLIPDMIDKARELVPSGKFICEDLFSRDSTFTDQFQVVFTSGIFNLNIGNNEEFFQKAITVLDRLASETLVINLLRKTGTGYGDDYYYFSPDRTREMLAQTGRVVEIVDGYLEADFTLIGVKK